MYVHVVAVGCVICPFGKTLGGLQTLHEIAGVVQPPLAVHERVVGVP